MFECLKLSVFAVFRGWMCLVKAPTRSCWIAGFAICRAGLCLRDTSGAVFSVRFRDSFGKVYERCACVFVFAVLQCSDSRLFACLSVALQHARCIALLFGRARATRPLQTCRLKAVMEKGKHGTKTSDI